MPVEITDDHEEVFMESAKDFPDDPEDYPEEIKISMNGSTFRARSLLFENNVVFDQYKCLEEEAYGKGGDVLVLGGGSEEREVEEEKGEVDETEDQLVGEEDETILESGGGRT